DHTLAPVISTTSPTVKSDMASNQRRPADRARPDRSCAVFTTYPASWTALPDGLARHLTIVEMHASATDDLVILVAFAGDEAHVPGLRLPDGRFDGLTAIGHHPVPAPCRIQRLPKARFHFRDDGHPVLAARA